MAALAACAEPSTDLCAAGQVCPPFTLCGPNGTCPAVPTECARFENGTPCAAADRALCQEGECLPSVCGDTFTDAVNGESCDLGDANSSVPDAECRLDCTLRRCGDGTTDSDEACDGGAANSDVTPNACRSSCEEAFCGDGVRDQGEEQSCFGIASEFEVGLGPAFLVRGDINGDGREDFIVSNTGSDDNTILLGMPGGQFATGPSLSTGDALPQGLALGDLTGDDVLDLAVVNGNDDSLSVFVGVGDGSFGPPTSVAAGVAPIDVAIAHLDDDGNRDIVTVSRDSGELIVFGGNGDGTLTERHRVAVGVGANAVAVADLDDNDIIDAAVTTASSNAVTVAFDVGLLDAAPPPMIADVGETPSGLVLADLDGDERHDIAVANTASQDVSILRNLGNGAFAPEQRIPALAAPNDLAVGLVDDDELVDLVLSHATDPFLNKLSLSVLRGTPGGGFVSSGGVNLPNTPSATDVALVDLNRDGRLDAVFTSPPRARTYAVLGGDGTLGRRFAYGVGENPFYVQVADLDRDGNGDVLAVDRGAGDVVALMGLGEGLFAAPRTVIEGESARAVEIADFNYDTHQDVVVMNSANGEAVVYFGDGTGALAQGGRYSVGDGAGVLVVDSGDLDRDGVLDLVAGNSSDDLIHILRGNADGTFEPAQIFRGWEGGNAAVLRLADMNQDEVLDLVVSSSGKAAGLFLGAGDGTFGQEPVFVDGLGGRNMAIGDLTGDGRPDIARMEADGRKLDIISNRGGGQFELFSSTVLDIPIRYIEVADVNGDGRDDLIGVDTVDDKVAIFLGREGATVAEPQVFAAGEEPTFVATGDLNGDGLPDVTSVGEDLSIFISHPTLGGN